MCNLYSQTAGVDAVRDTFGVTRINPSAGNLPSLPAIFPGHDAPVIRNCDGGRELLMMNWGFVLPQKDKVAKRVTNARDEKVRDSRFWKGSFEERRCLVPVTSFSEPKGLQPAVWHWFGLKGDEARPLFSFAGLWRSWKGPLKRDSEFVELNVYSFLTTTPNEVVKPIHPNRMPVLLNTDEQYDTWLNGLPDEAFALAKPLPAEAMHIVHKGEKKDAA